LNFDYYIIHKPFQVLSQFSREGTKAVLADYFSVPKDVYPVGRLDYDSEGLLLLTNDKRVNFQLLHPSKAHVREYWVQVDGAITPTSLKALVKGVLIRIDGKEHVAKALSATVFEKDPEVSERHPPIRYRKDIPTSWIRLVLTEGKNRQVRRMTAAVGFPTLRLIRYRIGGLTLDGMEPGGMRQLSESEIQKAFIQS
jgi:23S rRNA pseudouridine2457 synthase